MPEMTDEKNDPDSLMPRDVVKQLEDLRARLLAGRKDLQAEMKRHFEEKNQRGDQRLAILEQIAQQVSNLELMIDKHGRE